jgi:hypothetical protein
MVFIVIVPHGVVNEVKGCAWHGGIPYACLYHNLACKLLPDSHVERVMARALFLLIPPFIPDRPYDGGQPVTWYLPGR